MTIAPDEVIHFACTTCGKALTVPRHMAGVTGPCPHCRNTITSPAAPAPVPVMQGFMPPPQWEMPSQAPVPQQLPVLVLQNPLIVQPPQQQQIPAAPQATLPVPGSSLWGQTAQTSTLPNPAGSSHSTLLQTRSSALWAEGVPAPAQTPAPETSPR